LGKQKSFGNPTTSTTKPFQKLKKPIKHSKLQIFSIKKSKIDKILIFNFTELLKDTLVETLNVKFREY
jgi:hypothetical protein